VHNYPEAEAQKNYAYALSLPCHLTELLGFCQRIIGNEKPLNLEKTTYSVLSVLFLMYGSNV